MVVLYGLKFIIQFNGFLSYKKNYWNYLISASKFSFNSYLGGAPGFSLLGGPPPLAKKFAQIAYIPVQNSHYNLRLHPLCMQMQGIN